MIHPSLVPADGWAGLDVVYLGILPDDAVPVLVDALPHLPPADAETLRGILDDRRRVLVSDVTAARPAAWNLGRERARAALATLP